MAINLTSLLFHYLFKLSQMSMNSIVLVLALTPAFVLAFDFPTFNEKRTGVPIEVIAEGYGRLGDFNVLKTLGQECIDAINLTPKRELNIVVLADSPMGSSVGILFQDSDRFGKKYVTKTFKCNFNKKLTEIVSIDK